MSTNPYATGGAPAPGYEAWEERPGRTRTSALAVASLILSILCLTSPLGVILGVAALFVIARSAGRLTGRGLALTGVVIGLAASLFLTMGLVGSMVMWRSFQGQFSQPVAAIMKSLDERAYGDARSKLSPAINLSDEQVVAFADAIRAEMGAFRGTPQSPMEYFESFAAIGPAMQTSQGPAQALRNPVPVVVRYENGACVVWVKVSERDLTVINLLAATNKGTLTYLVDPASKRAASPAPEAPAQPPPPAQVTPEAPPAQPEPAKPAPGG